MPASYKKKGNQQRINNKNGTLTDTSQVERGVASHRYCNNFNCLLIFFPYVQWGTREPIRQLVEYLQAGLVAGRSAARHKSYVRRLGSRDADGCLIEFFEV